MAMHNEGDPGMHHGRVLGFSITNIKKEREYSSCENYHTTVEPLFFVDNYLLEHMAK